MNATQVTYSELLSTMAMNVGGRIPMESLAVALADGISKIGFRTPKVRPEVVKRGEELYMNYPSWAIGIETLGIAEINKGKVTNVIHLPEDNHLNQQYNDVVVECGSVTQGSDGNTKNATSLLPLGDGFVNLRSWHVSQDYAFVNGSWLNDKLNRKITFSSNIGKEQFIYILYKTGFAGDAILPRELKDAIIDCAFSILYRIQDPNKAAALKVSYQKELKVFNLSRMPSPLSLWSVSNRASRVV